MPPQNTILIKHFYRYLFFLFLKTISQFLEKMYYNEEKTKIWVSQILDTTLKELSKLNKPFKYVGNRFILIFLIFL